MSVYLASVLSKVLGEDQDRGSATEDRSDRDLKLGGSRLRQHPQPNFE